MRNITDPRQDRLFDPFQGLFPPARPANPRNRLAGDVPPCASSKCSPSPNCPSISTPALGAPTKELYSMAGLVFLADFHGWTAQQAAEAYMFHTDVQFALNLEPGAQVSSRSVERYQKLFRDDDLAAAGLRAT